MPLRVLWVIKGLGPGGAEHLLVAAARAHDPEVATIECAFVLSWKDHLAEQLELAGVRTICLSTGQRDRRWPFRLRRTIRDGRYDIVHVHSPLPGSVARIIARLLPAVERPAVVCTEHNVWTQFHAGTRWANRLSGRWDAAVLAVTSESQKSMRGPMAAKSEVLVHGIDLAATAALASQRAAVRSELGIETAQLVIGTVANFREQKDYPNLMAAVRVLIDRGVPVRLLAVGQGPLESAVRDLRARLDLNSEVLLTGYRSDAARVMSAADVFVLASMWEGLPVALMEALSLGLPVVATNVGGVGEALRPEVDALLVPPSDSIALADALQRVLDDESLRSRLGSAAWAKAAEFDVRRAVRRIESVYAAVAPARAVQPLAPSSPHRQPPPRGLEIRRASAGDRAAILELGRRALGWGNDSRYAELYSWKHDQNPFGESPTWVATDGGRVIGLRTFMRWEFTRGSEMLRAVRAVDTATDPDYQGKGLFTALTLHALDELIEEGIAFVFNTPNNMSRPGYLKMGWQTVGQLPAAVRLKGPKSLVTTARARVGAELWSLPLDIGRPFTEWLDSGDFDFRTRSPGSPRDLTTRTDEAFLRWRYGMPLLQYRSISIDGGVVIARARMRGSAHELALVDTLGASTQQSDEAAGGLLAHSLCDHAIRLGSSHPTAGFVSLPGGGPVLTWRSLAMRAAPPLGNWQLRLGDVELF